MFTLPEVKIELNKRYNQDVELDFLEKCVHIWNINQADSIEEDEEYYDEHTIRQIYRGIKLERNGYNEAIISEILSKTSYTPDAQKAIVENTEEEQITSKDETERRLLNQTNPAKMNEQSNVINIKEPEKQQIALNTPKSSNTDNLVAKLSESVAEKVITEMLDYLKDDAFLDRLDDIGSLKRDNEILSKQVKELVLANETLETKLFEFEMEKRSFKKIWKNLFYKI